jgi:hypothetical protein
MLEVVLWDVDGAASDDRIQLRHLIQWHQAQQRIG